jgi:hypothetical protein
MVTPTLVVAWWLVSFPAAAQSPLPVDALESDPAAQTADVGGADVPEQRVKLKLVTPAIVRAAEELLDLPLGTEEYMTVDGKRYVFVLERHYHPQGFVGAPNGWHKGVTVYAVE